MQYYIENFFLLSILIVFYQFYTFAVSRKAVEKQINCQILGIVYTTLGVLCLVIHDISFVVAGLVLIMLGLRLIAHGLDRIDKKIFIDRLDEDQ
jgi:uncharacterized membrane protein